MGIYRSLRSLGSAWVSAKTYELKHRGTPQTAAQTGGSTGSVSFDGQTLDRDDLRRVREIRESGGLVAELYSAKALMRYGSGAELQAEEDAVEDWLADALPHLDDLVLSLGEDAVWYPYGLGEIVATRGGDFSHIELIEPWTMLPETDPKGEIDRWMQEVQADYHTQEVPFSPEKIGSIIVNRSSGRDKTGISDVLQNEEEITQYREHQHAIDNAVEMAGFPHNHWIVGRENATTIHDQELRRVRNIIDDLKSDTQLVTGPDVGHERIEPTTFDFTSITEHDLRLLTGAIGVPIELANFGSDGLGSGMPAEFRLEMLALKNEADRRRFANQFTEQFLRPILEQFSPFSADADVGLRIKPFLDEKADMAELINKVGGYMRTDEVRERLDLPPLEDEELSTSFRSPEEAEGPDEEEQPPMGGGSGFFSELRELQEVPDNAVPIDDPSEAPEDAQVITGPRGGTYYVPAGEGGDGEPSTGNVSISDVEPGDEVQVDAVIEGPDGEPVDISGDDVEVLDADPNYGLLIDHPEFGRGEVRVDDINGITDPDAEPDDGAEPADATIEGIDTDDTVEGSETILSDVEKERIEERLVNAHGDAGEQAHGWANEWRQNSISGAAESFASAIKDASNLDGDVRDSGREAADPTAEEVDAVEDMIGMSREFFRDKFGEETELVRGTRENGRDDFLMSVFGGEDNVEINANAVDNYTSEEELAQNYAGDDGLVLRPTVSADDVQVANASLFAEGFETEGDEYLIDSPNEISADDAEVRINGESITMASEPTDMSQDDFRTLAAEMDQASPELQDAFEQWAGDLA